MKSAGYGRGFPGRPQGKSGNDFKLEGVASVELRLWEVSSLLMVTGELRRRVLGTPGLSWADASLRRVRVAEPGCLGSEPVSPRVQLLVLLAPEGS